eukprot:1159597-Pelagomonas_calceolata.AAC.21
MTYPCSDAGLPKLVLTGKRTQHSSNQHTHTAKAHLVLVVIQAGQARNVGHQHHVAHMRQPLDEGQHRLMSSAAHRGLHVCDVAAQHMRQEQNRQSACLGSMHGGVLCTEDSMQVIQQHMTCNRG